MKWANGSYQLILTPSPTKLRLSAQGSLQDNSHNKSKEDQIPHDVGGGHGEKELAPYSVPPDSQEVAKLQHFQLALEPGRQPQSLTRGPRYNTRGSHQSLKPLAGRRREETSWHVVILRQTRELGQVYFPQSHTHQHHRPDF